MHLCHRFFFHKREAYQKNKEYEDKFSGISEYWVSLWKGRFKIRLPDIRSRRCSPPEYRKSGGKYKYLRKTACLYRGYLIKTLEVRGQSSFKGYEETKDHETKQAETWLQLCCIMVCSKPHFIQRDKDICTETQNK